MSCSRKLRILITDDSPMACDLIEALFSLGEDFEVVGRAPDGQKAVEMNESLEPDLVTMDLHMPVMDGYEAVEHIMASRPVPILVITSFREAETAFRCISLGAVEVMDKPDIDQVNDEIFSSRFLEQARFLAGTRVIRRPKLRRRNRKEKAPPAPEAEVAAIPAPVPAETIEPLPGPRKPIQTLADTLPCPRPPGLQPPRRLLAIAASTGGPEALSALLGALPADMPCGILVVQHLAPGFERGLVAWLSGCTHLRVLLAVHGAPVLPGLVCIAPPGQHMIVTKDVTMELVDEPPVSSHRPSAKYLFESAARVFGVDCAGLILTGMGADGAEALGAIRDAGGVTLAQDEASSIIYGMPKAAADLGTAQQILSLSAMPAHLLHWAVS